MAAARPACLLPALMGLWLLSAAAMAGAPAPARPRLAPPLPRPWVWVPPPALPRQQAFFGLPGAQQTPPLIALTFDDGPSPTVTPRLLDAARELGVQLTFFVVGQAVRRSPALLRRMLAEGHALGNHTEQHLSGPLGAGLAWHEVTQTTQAIRQASGAAVTLFRAPGGHLDTGVAWAAWQQGLQVIGWNDDPRDYTRGISADQIVETVLREARPGAVVVLHDGGGPREATLAAFPLIVAALRAQGYALVTVPQLLAAAQPEATSRPVVQPTTRAATRPTTQPAPPPGTPRPLHGH